MKTFVSVSKTSSFRVAAQRNNITQPAVSQHIRILERKFNTLLFERQGKKTFLTPSGKMLLTYAESMLNQYAEAKMRINELNNKFTGTIHMVTIYSIGLHDLQPRVKAFLQKYPHIEFNLDYNHSKTIYEMVLDRTVDFGMVAFPKKTSGIIVKIFDEDKLILVQSTHNPIFKKKTIPLEKLNQEKFVTFSSKTPTGRMINQFLKSKNIIPYTIQEYDNIETLKSAVQIGMGCAIVPHNTVVQELKNRTLETVTTRGLNMKRPLGILHAKGKIFTKSTQSFLQMMTKEYKA